MKISKLLQTLGVALLFAAAVFWAWTGRESVVLMMSAVTLVGLGAFQGAQVPRSPSEEP